MWQHTTYRRAHTTGPPSPSPRRLARALSNTRHVSVDFLSQRLLPAVRQVVLDASSSFSEAPPSSRTRTGHSNPSRRILTFSGPRRPTLTRPRSSLRAEFDQRRDSPITCRDYDSMRVFQRGSNSPYLPTSSEAETLVRSTLATLAVRMHMPCRLHVRTGTDQ